MFCFEVRSKVRRRGADFVTSGSTVDPFSSLVTNATHSPPVDSRYCFDGPIGTGHMCCFMFYVLRFVVVLDCLQSVPLSGGGLDIEFGIYQFTKGFDRFCRVRAGGFDRERSPLNGCERQQAEDALSIDLLTIRFDDGNRRLKLSRTLREQIGRPRVHAFRISDLNRF